MEYMSRRSLWQLENGDPDDLDTGTGEIPEGMTLGQRDLLRLERRLNQLQRACEMLEGYPLTINERDILMNIRRDGYHFHEFFYDDLNYATMSEVVDYESMPRDMEYAEWVVRILEHTFDSLVWMVFRRLGIRDGFYERTYRTIQPYHPKHSRSGSKKKKKRRASPGQFVWLGSSGDGILVDPNTGDIISRDPFWTP